MGREHRIPNSMGSLPPFPPPFSTGMVWDELGAPTRNIFLITGTREAPAEVEAIPPQEPALDTKSFSVIISIL